MIFTAVNALLASARRHEIKLIPVMVRHLEKRQHGLCPGLGENQFPTVLNG